MKGEAPPDQETLTVSEVLMSTGLMENDPSVTDEGTFATMRLGSGEGELAELENVSVTCAQ